MIVTIDGPAGAGKSTVARMLAKRLGFQFLDTGAMYRAIAWAFNQMKVDLTDDHQVAAAMEKIRMAIDGDRISVNDHEVTDQIRDTEVTQHASRVATHPGIREALVQLQRDIASQGNFVCEGRDQGTVVFPDAVCKVFLNAAPEIRAERRWKQMSSENPDLDLEEVITEQKIRDLRDETREVGRLQKAPDAVEIRVDELTLDEIVDEIEKLFRHSVESAGLH